MSRPHPPVLCALATMGPLLLSGCITPLSQRVQPVQDFYDAASKLSQAEQQTYTDLDAARVRLKRLEQEVHYLKDENFTLEPPQPLAPAAQLRFDAVNALQLYAQTLVRLTGSEPNKTVDSYTEAVAGKIKSAWTTAGIARAGQFDDKTAGIISAAFAGIANLALDIVRSRKIHEAAAEAQPHLVALAALLKQDDAILSAEYKRLDDEMPTVGEQILLRYRASYKTDPGRLNDFFKANTTDYDAYLAAKTRRATIGDLADAVVRANAALANDDRVSFVVLAKDASRLGSDAVGVYKIIKGQ